MFDVDKFITMVEERPALYDPWVKAYNSREAKTHCWREIGSQTCVNWDTLNESQKREKEKQLSKKWKAIRDNFVKDNRHRQKLKNGVGVPKRRPYIYYSALQFLLPIIESNEEQPDRKVVPRKVRTPAKTRPIRPIRPKLSANTPATSSKSEDNRTEEAAPQKEPAVREIFIDDIGNIKTNFSSVSSISSTTNPPKDVSPSDRDKDVFGNRAFLLSYLPIMDDLPSDLALEARLRITEVFRNVCAARASRKSMHSDQNLILPEALVEMVDVPDDDDSHNADFKN